MAVWKYDNKSSNKMCGSRIRTWHFSFQALASFGVLVMPTFDKMNNANRAMCFALRNPPRGEKPLRFSAIRKIVRKTDGTRPSIQAIQKAASTYKDKKGQRGRPAGSTVTTKE